MEFLKSAALLIPVPFLRGTIEVAIKVLQICQVWQSCTISKSTLKFFYQDVIEIEATAQALQDRVSKIMSAIVVTTSDIKDAASRIESDVTNLGGQVSALSKTETNLMRVLLHRTYYSPRTRRNQRQEAIEEAANVIQDSSIHKRIRAVVGRIHGEILISLNRHEEALSRLKPSLELAREDGHVLGIAWTLEHFGYIYASRGDYEDAIMAYTAAADTYRERNAKTSLVGKEGMRRCQKNLTTVEEKQKIGGRSDIALLRFVSAV